MTATAEQISASLKKREQEAWEAVAQIQPTHEAWGLAIAARKSAYAKSFLLARSEGKTVAESEQVAERDTADLKAEEMAAEGIAKAALEAARLARDMVSSGQTIAGAYKHEIDLSKTGPGM